MLLLYLILASAASAAERAATDRDHFNYMIHCQGCHRADGSGTDGATPDLRSYGARFLNDARGREYYVRVPGSRNSPLSDRELAGVLNHIIDDVLGDGTESSAGIRYFSEQEVAASRPRPLQNAAESRLQLIHRLDAGPLPDNRPLE
jgi:hypothetical protein